MLLGTPLSRILNAMDQWQVFANAGEQEKVRAIDLALQVERANYKLPFRRHKTTVRVFDGIVEYPLPSDYDELSYLDNDKKEYGDRARFKFQSYNEFFEDKDYRNDWAEIHQSGSVRLGCRYKDENAATRLVEGANALGSFTTSDDASGEVLDQVTYKEGSGSIRFTNTSNTGATTLENTFTAFADTLYKKKYYFVDVYLDAVPTSITLKYGPDDSNYLYATVTEQFSGQAFEADAWNTIAIDLNTASTQGTVNGSSFGYESLILTGAASGTYYRDASYVRSWVLLDLWYYTKYMVQESDETLQEFFLDASEQYSTDTNLVGPPEWSSFIMFSAGIYVLSNRQDRAALADFNSFRTNAENKLKDRHKSVTPQITNSYWRFQNDYRNTRYGGTV